MFQRKADAILWRIREIELCSQLAEFRQRFAELDCLHDAENASNTLQQHQQRNGGLSLAMMMSLSGASSMAPTPEVTRSVVGRRVVGGMSRDPGDRLSAMWKDIPPAIMTDSIGPLEDLCILPDDPLITSIYMNGGGTKK